MCILIILVYPIFLDDSTGPAKVRRMIEHLRTDVVKGLGVKLLDRVLDIMQEENEDKREVGHVVSVPVL